MSKINKGGPATVRVPTTTVKRTAKIAKIIRILLYLGIAFMLFSQAKAEGEFGIRKIKIGSQILEVEIADNDFKRSLGLMNRKTLNEGKGMLFVFDQEQPLSFWMKNTLIPLSIGYFGSDKKLYQVLDMKPASPLELRPPSYPSSRPGQYALEVPVGWFKKHKIKPGIAFSFVEEKKSTDPRQ
jgi:uncharacterized protein